MLEELRLKVWTKAYIRWSRFKEWLSKKLGKSDA
jgi:hypothetical protein